MLNQPSKPSPAVITSTFPSPFKSAARYIPLHLGPTGDHDLRPVAAGSVVPVPGDRVVEKRGTKDVGIPIVVQIGREDPVGVLLADRVPVANAVDILLVGIVRGGAVVTRIRNSVAVPVASRGIRRLIVAVLRIAEAVAVRCPCSRGCSPGWCRRSRRRNRSRRRRRRLCSPRWTRERAHGKGEIDLLGTPENRKPEQHDRGEHGQQPVLSSHHASPRWRPNRIRRLVYES